MGIPKEAVQHAMKKDHLDPAILDLDPDNSLKSQLKSEDDGRPPLKDDPKYMKVIRIFEFICLSSF